MIQEVLKRATRAPLSSTWWKESKGAKVADAIIRTSRGLESTQLGVQTRNYRSALLYGGNQYLSGSRFSPRVAAPTGPMGMAGASARSGPRYNLVYSVINTVVARMLAPGLPRVTFLTNDGDFELQHKAKLLDQFVEGLSYQVGLEAVASKALKDCCVFGNGWIKFWADETDNIHADRIFPNEIWAEMWDSRDAAPRSLFQIGTADRDQLARRFPKFKNQILNQRPIPSGSYGGMAEYNSNIIPYFEGWHRPSSRDADDGRNVIAIDGIAEPLQDIEYTDDEFPFASICYDDGLTGMLGIGMAELLYGHQAALNDVTKAEYFAHSQMSLPRLWSPVNSKINKNHLTSSRSGLIIEGFGEPPQALNFSATTPNFVQYKEWIIQSAYEFVGVSKLAAAAQKPAGLDAAVAIRENMDIQQDRMADLSYKWGQFRVDCSKRMVSLARHLYKKNKSFSIKVIGKNFIKELDFGKADISDDEYRLKAYPAALLPRQPAGRLQKLQELRQSGDISHEQFMRLLDAPDIDDEVSVTNAARDNARRTAYLLLQEGKYSPPDPIQDPAQCVPVVLSETLRAIDNGAPKERIALARRWLVQARTTWPNFGQQPQPAGQPSGVPAKPPVSQFAPGLPQGVQAAA